MPDKSDSKRSWGPFDDISSLGELRVGDTLKGIPYGQGIGEILEFQRNEDGDWTKIRISYVSGCMPVEPDGHDETPKLELEFPTDTTWIDREKLEEL